MENKTAASEFLVISRGKWDANLPPERIEKAISDFYIWLEEMVAAGKMKRGQRLATGGKTVSKSGILDGPFGETKEIIGGYWFIVASDLEEAASIASRNPCMQCGLFYEIRPVDPERASAYVRTNETPERTA